MASSFPSRDPELVQIVDSALADATRRSGHWLVCKPGCTQCCVGVFAIHQLDAERLRRGFTDLYNRDPQRATGIRERARRAVTRLSADFPGDPASGLLDEGFDLAESDFGDDEPCPVLDPTTGRCELYESRPMTCRVFGPPVLSESGLGTCELCFQGASAEEIARCEMKPDPDDMEAAVLAELAENTGKRGSTIIAFCLAE